MSATTIASYGGNGQKDVCFRSWRQRQISAAFNGGDGGVWRIAGAAQRFSLGMFDAHRGIAELTIPDPRLGAIGGAGASL